MAEITTARILANKALDVPCGQDCVDWAVGMLVSGYDGPSLTMLAGMLPPHNHFEVADLRDRALGEVGAPDLREDEAVLVYTAETLRLMLRDEAGVEETLRVLKDLCIARDHSKDLFDFYLLFFAYTDLQKSTVQWYWDGATRQTIDSIIRRRAVEFIAHVSMRGDEGQA